MDDRVWIVISGGLVIWTALLEADRPICVRGIAWLEHCLRLPAVLGMHCSASWPVCGPLWRGSYLVVYEIDDDEQVINVVRIDRRADIYRPH